MQWVEVDVFFQAEDGIRDLVRSRGLGDVYKRQKEDRPNLVSGAAGAEGEPDGQTDERVAQSAQSNCCLLYTSDAADERSSVDLGGRRIIKKKKQITQYMCVLHQYMKTIDKRQITSIDKHPQR